MLCSFGIHRFLPPSPSLNALLLQQQEGMNKWRQIPRSRGGAAGVQTALEREAPRLSTDNRAVTCSTSPAQSLEMSSGKRVNQGTAETGLNHSAASVYLLILLQQQHMLFDPVPLSPCYLFCLWLVAGES